MLPCLNNQGPHSQVPQSQGPRMAQRSTQRSTQHRCRTVPKSTQNRPKFVPESSQHMEFHRRGVRQWDSPVEFRRNSTGGGLPPCKGASFCHGACTCNAVMGLSDRANIARLRDDGATLAPSLPFGTENSPQHHPQSTPRPTKAAPWRHSGRRQRPFSLPKPSQELPKARPERLKRF